MNDTIHNNSKLTVLLKYMKIDLVNFMNEKR